MPLAQLSGFWSYGNTEHMQEHMHHVRPWSNLTCTIVCCSPQNCYSITFLGEVLSSQRKSYFWLLVGLVSNGEPVVLGSHGIRKWWNWLLAKYTYLDGACHFMPPPPKKGLSLHFLIQTSNGITAVHCSSPYYSMMRTEVEEQQIEQPRCSRHHPTFPVSGGRPCNSPYVWLVCRVVQHNTNT